MILKRSTRLTDVYPTNFIRLNYKRKKNLRFICKTYCVNTKIRLTTTIVNDTNVMAMKSVNVCDDRHSFDGGLQKLIKTIFYTQKNIEHTTIVNKIKNYFSDEFTFT